MTAVSIPFKREGVSKVETHREKLTEHAKFQFPSNGKAHSDSQTRLTATVGTSFNSLQTGRHIQTYQRCLQGFQEVKEFQFPSNGKAHSDDEPIYFRITDENGFNSLQTGRHIQTQPITNAEIEAVSFQFPSNGKAHSDITIAVLAQCLVAVSIPFKREGTFRLFAAALTIPYKTLFQFPSNGKAHSDDNEKSASRVRDVLFQFPSNGKAHSDTNKRTIRYGVL